MIAEPRVRIEFSVWGNPAPGGSKRAVMGAGSRVRVIDANPRTAPWKRHVARIARQYMEDNQLPLLEGAVRATYEFIRPRPKSHYRANGKVKERFLQAWPSTRPDATKLVRSTEDALTGVCWADDAQVVVMEVSKVYGESAGVKITIEEVSE